MSFAAELPGRFDLVHRFSEEAQRGTEQFIQVLRERALLEETYARGLERISSHTSVLGARGSMAEALNALKTDGMNKAAVARTLAEALTNDLAEPLDRFLKEQKKSCKGAHDQGNALQADLSAANTCHTEAYSKYWQISHEAEEVAVVMDSSKDQERRAKAHVKLGILKREIADSLLAYQRSISEYNSAKDRFDQAISSVLQTYQEKEESRLSYMKDLLRKLVVYETSALRNLQYDIDQLAKKMEEIEPQRDIQIFVDSNKQANASSHYQFAPYLPADPGKFQQLLDTAPEAPAPEQGLGIAGIFSKLTDRLFPEVQSENLKQALDPLIQRVWTGQHLSLEDRLSFTTAVREKPGRKAWAACINQRRLNGQVEIHRDGFPVVVEHMMTVLTESQRQSDASVGKVCIIAAQTFYRVREDGEKEFLEVRVGEHPVWQDLSFWEQMIQEAIEEEVKRTGAAEAEAVKNVAFCQLGTFANYMAAFHVDQMFAGELTSRVACRHDLSEDDQSTLMGIVGKDMMSPDVRRGVPRWLLELEGHTPVNLKSKVLSGALAPPSPDESVMSPSPDRLSDVKDRVPRSSLLPLDEILQKSLPQQSPDSH